MKRINENQKYFWAPSIKWEQKTESVKIEMFIYNDFVPVLFPTFYFLCQKGITINECCDRFPDISQHSLKLFFYDLIKKRILVNSVLSPQELFYSQNSFHLHNYPESIKYDETALKKFKQEQLSRQYYSNEEGAINLLTDNNIPDIIKNRRTYRSFKEDEMVTFDNFSNFLSVLKQSENNGEKHYYYASAGGLYPVDIYLYVKPKRVDKIPQGIYYYNPVKNLILFIGEGIGISSDSQFFTNQAIHDSSAFSMYFIYNCDVSMPKYEGMGYYYAAIDTGIIVSTLTNIAGSNNLCVCSIGDMNFKKIKNHFQLFDHQIFLHSMEVGLKTI